MLSTIIVVPCYNEANRLDQPRFRDFVQRSTTTTLLFVNDGSCDETLSLLHDLRRVEPSRILIHDLAQNSGKAEVVRQGFLKAFSLQPWAIGYLDADLATPLEAVSDLQAVLHRRPHLQLVMGSRVALLGRRIERRFRRHLLGRTFAIVASRALGIAVYDTQCGAKLFRASPQLRAIFRDPFLSRWIFDVELLARMTLLAKSGALPAVEEIIFELPLDCWRDIGQSKVKPWDFLKAAMELAAIYRTYRLGPTTRLAPLNETLQPTKSPESPLPESASVTRESGLHGNRRVAA